MDTAMMKKTDLTREDIEDWIARRRYHEMEKNWMQSFDEANPDLLEFPETEYIATSDVVTEPAHYTRWKIEPITFIMRNGFEFWRGNIVKYVSRAGFKFYPDKTEVESEIIDLEKVIRYAEMRINQLKGETKL